MMSFCILLNILEDDIINWVFVHIPTIGVCIIMMWIAWWTRGRWHIVRERFSKVERNCVQLDKNQIALNNRLGSIDTKLSTLIIHLSSTKKIDSNLFRSNSPIELTEVGAKILVEMGGKSYIDTHLDLLIRTNAKSGF